VPWFRSIHTARVDSLSGLCRSVLSSGLGGAGAATGSDKRKDSGQVGVNGHQAGRFGFLVALAVFALPALPASAHPHVWVTVKTTVLYDGGRIVGLRHAWTFDDAYTEMAIEGLDTNNDGVYSREELAELAKVNVDGLKEFGYFTYAKLGETPIGEKEPTDSYLDYKDKLLTLYFTLPFVQPVPADAKGFNFAVFDESFFIAFDFSKDDPVVLGSGAPKDCSVDIAIPKNELEQLQALNKSFGGQLTAGDANIGMGFGYAKTVSLQCKRS